MCVQNLCREQCSPKRTVTLLLNYPTIKLWNYPFSDAATRLWFSREPHRGSVPAAALIANEEQLKRGDENSKRNNENK